MSVCFDNARAQAALAPSGIAPAPLSAYFERIVDYALVADWGRRPVRRASAAALAED